MKGLPIDSTLESMSVAHTASQLREVFDYDPDTGRLSWLESTGPRGVVGEEAGWCDESGYRKVQVGGKQYLVHRVIWCLMTGQWPSTFVDHEDTNKSNNKWNNLRLATRAENNANTSLLRNNTSGVKGVTWHKQHQKWYARVAHNGVTYVLGLFHNLQEAAEAVRNQREILHKEYTNHG